MTMRKFYKTKVVELSNFWDILDYATTPEGHIDADYGGNNNFLLKVDNLTLYV